MEIGTRMSSTRIGRLLLAAPLIGFLLLYSDGLIIWALADDFAWLGLIRGDVHSVHMIC